MKHLAYMALKEAKFEAVPAINALHKMTEAELQECSEAIEDYFCSPSMLKEAMRDDAYSALKEVRFETMTVLNRLHEITGATLPACSEVMRIFTVIADC